MKKKAVVPHRFESLSEIHRVVGISSPQHPLISFINNMDNSILMRSEFPEQFVLSFYKITYRPNLKGRLRYGQHYYDFDEGGLFFVSPHQVSGTTDKNLDHTGFTIFIHPDFLANYPLAKKIRQYGFFSYDTTEALHMSEQEKETILSIASIIEQELNSRIDVFSQDVIVAQLELLLTYANRFHQRQFITRKAANKDVLQKLEEILDNCFNAEAVLIDGLPTVQHIANQLNLTPSYLSDMLRSLTGHNAQQHIHLKLIEIAKEKLSTTNLSISEIAYQLGFEHPQSFSSLFKSKTKLSPVEFRQSFN